MQRRLDRSVEGVDSPTTCLIGWHTKPTWPKVHPLLTRTTMPNAPYVVLLQHKKRTSTLRAATHPWSIFGLSTNESLTSIFKVFVTLHSHQHRNRSCYSWTMRKNTYGKTRCWQGIYGMVDGRSTQLGMSS